MPTAIHKKFYCFRVTLSDGDWIVRPLMGNDYLWLNQSEKELANAITLQFNHYHSGEGRLLEIMHDFPHMQPESYPLSIHLPESQDKLRQAIDLNFDMYFAKLGDEEFLGFEPVFRTTSFGATLDELIENMQANISMALAREKKSDTLAKIIPTQWFKKTTVKAVDVFIETYSLNEIGKLEQVKNIKYLPGVADKINASSVHPAWHLEQEAEIMYDVLLGKFRRSILITGRPGVGKSALINGFVKKNQDKPKRPDIYKTNASLLINRLMSDVVWHENLVKVCKELREGNNILYIENFADLFEVGQYEGSNMSIADFLKEYIKRGDVTIISECTTEQLAAIDVYSHGYSSLFHIINLQEQQPDKLREIIFNSISKTALQNKMSISEDAIEETLRLQKRFTPYSGFPGKTIRFLESVIFENQNKNQNIDKDTVLDAFCQETGMPRFLIDQNIELRLDELESRFAENIHGQELAVKTVVDVIATFKAFLSRGEKPIASLLFAGPTGVGKTEMAKVMADYVFGNRKHFVRFDMSEFSDPWSVLRLTGQSNSAQGGLLTGAVRRNPFSVVLFDELEKAHFTFYDLLLQILGEGRLTDNRGEVVDFCSTIVIMTSNIGATNFGRSDLGFRKSGSTEKAAAKHFDREVQKFFRPELFNRIDQIVTFLPLNKQTIRRIVNRELKEIRRREGLLYRNISLHISDEVLDYLGENGYHIKYGARFLQRTIRKQLLIPLAKILNHIKYEKHVGIGVAVQDGKIVFKVEKSGKKTEFEDRQQKILCTANEATKVRRYILQLRENPHFVKILSRLDELKIHKKKYQFYNDQEALNKYNHVEKIITTCDELDHEITGLERKWVKTFFNYNHNENEIITYNANIYSKLEDLRLRIYDENYPEDREAIIAIYGKAENIEIIVKMYLRLAQLRGLDAKARSVWFHLGDHSYKEGLSTERDKTVRGNLYGFEIQIKGPATYRYFEVESGLQIVTDANGNDHKYFLMIQRGGFEKYKTPQGINRKSLFEKLKSRRNISGSLCEDLHYLLKYKDISNFTKHLAAYLDQKFSEKLYSELLTKDEKN